MEEKDYILENAKQIMREKGLNVENIAKAMGISTGEFSKILNGQRQDYFKHIPKMAEVLEVIFHQLVAPSAMTLQNNGEINDNGMGNVGHLHQNISKDFYERLIDECKEKDSLKNELIEKYKQDAIRWEGKYYNMKEKVVILEEKLNK